MAEIMPDSPSMLRKIFIDDRVIITAILINSLVIFLLSFKQLAGHSGLRTIDHAITLFFIIEVVVKMRHYSIRGYFQDNWNRFDFTIVT
ncbi:MAG: ion transporter, partial [Desulfobulbaceae bacterium]|nr:ion transporter [Desulfobulbaceae bacterium]